MPLPLIPMALGAWSWFKGSKGGKIVIFLLGGFLLLLIAYFKGRGDKAKDQRIDDLEHGADIRRRTDAAKQRHDADMAQLPEDDDARRDALAERLLRQRARGGD